MQRTQIYLSDGDIAVLDAAAARTGASRSELIRRAIQQQYGVGDRESRLAAIRASAGVLHDFPLTGEEYVESIRGDLNERLRRLGLD